MIRIEYTTLDGMVRGELFSSISDMRARLAYLDRCEAETVKYAPTDTGRVRINCRREARALRKALDEMSPSLKG